MRAIKIAAAVVALLHSTEAIPFNEVSPFTKRDRLFPVLESRDASKPYVAEDPATWAKKTLTKSSPTKPEADPAKIEKSLFTKRGSCADGPEWDLTAENWKAQGIDQWLKNWWDAQPKKENFYNQLFKAHANIGQAKCDAATPCSAPECSDLKNPNDPKPFIAMNGIANFVLWMNSNYGAVGNLASFQALKNAGFVNTYSSVGQEKPRDLVGKLLASALTNVIAGGVGFIPAIGNAASGAVRGMAGILFADVDNAGSLKFDKFADLGNAVARMTEAARKRIMDDTVALIKGQNDKAGNNLFFWLSNGAFARWEEGQETKLDDWYKMMTASALVNQLWREDSTYIVRAPTGDCINDPRFTNDMKWCDPEDGSHVYYIYGYNRLVKNGLQYPQIGQPLGWKTLQDDFGINRQLIIWASVKAWKIAKYNYTPDQARQRFMDGMASPDEKNRPTFWTAGWEGTWTIPICDSQDGRAVDSGSGNDMRYPCQCGAKQGGEQRPMVASPGPTYSDNEPFQAAAFLKEDKRFQDYCWNKQCCASTMSPFCPPC